MSTVYTDTYIIDLALAHLNEGATLNANDPRPIVKLLRRHLDVARDELLRAHAWTFAIGREVLAPDAVPPKFGFAYRYELPADWVRSLQPTETGRFDGVTIPHRIEGRYLLTDAAPPLRYVYIKRPRDNSEFAPDFVTALAANLAWRAANPATGKAQLADWLYKVAAEAFKKAAASNESEGSIERPIEKNSVVDMAAGMIEYAPSISQGDRREVTQYLIRQYEPVARELLARHPWNFATARKALDAADAPPFGWRHAYHLPDDCLRVTAPTCGGRFESPDVPYQIEGRLLLTDYGGPLYLVYVRSILDPTQFPPDFHNALAATMASRAVSGHPQKAGMFVAATQSAERLLLQAQVTDGMQGNQPRPEATTWQTGRFTGVTEGAWGERADGRWWGR